MIKSSKGVRAIIFILIGWFLMVGLTFSADIKMRVVADRANIYLSPDEKSPILETIEKGAIVGLLSPGKFKFSWYYVSYKSSAGVIKSGYIQETAVEPLFQAQRIITIKGDEGSLLSYSPLSHLEPDLWGASKEKIISFEGEPESQRRLENLEVLEYNRSFRGYETHLEYVFSDNRLIQVRLELWQVAGEKNGALQTYDQIKGYLQEKFGPPFEDSVNWENPTFKYDELSWGYAVSLGHLNYQTRWISANLELRLQLRGENKSLLLEFEGTQADFREVAKKIARGGSFHLN